ANIRTEQEEVKADEDKSPAAQVASAKDTTPGKLAENAKETPASKSEGGSGRQVPATGAGAAPCVTMQQFAEAAQGAPTSAAFSNVTVLAGNGALSGTVSDSSSALIPGLQITA